MRLTAATVFLCLIVSTAHSFQIDCDLVRSYVKEHGRAKALAFAIRNGATWKQLQEGRKCLQPNRK